LKLLKKEHINPHEVPAVLLRGHAPFVWADDCQIRSHECGSTRRSMQNEYIYTTIKPRKRTHYRKRILDKHYERKHGANAYYGQK
jgi:L-ribulose-5-phosphate 4-epimerase